MRRLRMFTGLFAALCGAYWIFMLYGFGMMTDPTIKGVARETPIWRVIISEPTFYLAVLTVIVGGWLMCHDPKRTT